MLGNIRWNGTYVISTFVIFLFKRFATIVLDDVQSCVKELEDEGSIPTTAVNFISNELASVYAATKRAQVSF